MRSPQREPLYEIEEATVRTVTAAAFILGCIAGVVLGVFVVTI